MQSRSPKHPVRVEANDCSELLSSDGRMVEKHIQVCRYRYHPRGNSLSCHEFNRHVFPNQRSISMIPIYRYPFIRCTTDGIASPYLERHHPWVRSCCEHCVRGTKLTCVLHPRRMGETMYRFPFLPPNIVAWPMTQAGTGRPIPVHDTVHTPYLYYIRYPCPTILTFLLFQLCARYRK